MHFCHGAPGVVFAMAEAHRVYGDDAFRDAACAGRDGSWQYGLLMKGPGLCHGVAGNGYALLAAYRVSRDPRWFHRAVVFGRVAKYRRRRRLRPDSARPGAPFSLFANRSGAVCFWTSTSVRGIADECGHDCRTTRSRADHRQFVRASRPERPPKRTMLGPVSRRACRKGENPRPGASTPT